MGTPIDMLLCASNENRVLTDFINTGTYDIADRPFVLTPSPSMDILVSSNLERQLFELTGRDAQAIRGWMDDLRAKGTLPRGPRDVRRRARLLRGRLHRQRHLPGHHQAPCWKSTTT